MVWLPDHIWKKQQKGKGKGKGSSKGGGAWVFVPMAPVKQTFFKKKGKGGGKAKKVPYSELSDDKKEEIRAKHAARAEEEGRETVGNNFHKGTLLKRGRFTGWIKPDTPAKFPPKVKAKLKEMTEAQKARAEEKGKADKFDEGVIYLRMSDVTEGVKVEPGMSVKFKIYVDNEGVGACEVDEA